MALVSENTKLVEWGIFRKENPDYTTITTHVKFLSKWVTPLSSVTYEIILDSTLSVILWTVIFLTLSVKKKSYILYHKYGERVELNMCL